MPDSLSIPLGVGALVALVLMVGGIILRNLGVKEVSFAEIKGAIKTKKRPVLYVTFNNRVNERGVGGLCEMACRAQLWFRVWMFLALRLKEDEETFDDVVFGATEAHAKVLAELKLEQMLLKLQKKNRALIIVVNGKTPDWDGLWARARELQLRAPTELQPDWPTNQDGNVTWAG